MDKTLTATESNELQGNINLIMKSDQASNHTSKRQKGSGNHTNSRRNHKDDHYTHNRNNARRSNRSDDDNESSKNGKGVDDDGQSQTTIQKQIKIILL